MRIICLICLMSAVSGCASYNGTPIPAINVPDTISRYTNDLEKLAYTPPSNCVETKAGVDKALTIMDLRYAEFIDDVSVESKTKATVTDFAAIGLGLAGTAVGGAGAKTVLHAISTGIASANTSIDKNYYYQNSIQALVAQMNADRKEKLAAILKRIASCKDDVKSEYYSWFEAVHDLTDYYAAGTLLGAISSIQKEAGKKQGVAESIIADIRQVDDISPSDSGNWLRNYIKPGGVADAIKRKRLIDLCIKNTPLWKENQYTSVVSEFLNSSRWESQRIACKAKLEGER